MDVRMLREGLTCNKALLEAEYTLGEFACDLSGAFLHRVGPFAQLPLLQLDHRQQLRPFLLPFPLLPLPGTQNIDNNKHEPPSQGGNAPKPRRLGGFLPALSRPNVASFCTCSCS